MPYSLFADLLALPTGDRYSPVMLDPKQRREQIFASLIDQLEALARQMPVQIVFEDAHWADSTSLELTQMVVERLPYLPVLLVITSRPEFTPPWTGQANVSTMALSRLDQRESATLVERVAGGKAMPHEILHSIVERADGIPLFIEELTKTVLEGGMLEEENDRYVLTAKLQSLAIPPNLHASLMARLDRLTSVKEIAQIGATIGREFSYELLARVANTPEAQLKDALDRLVSAGLVFNRGVPTTNRLHIQTCPYPGRCLQHTSAWAAPGSPCSNWQNTGGSLPRNSWHSTRDHSTSLHPGRFPEQGYRLLA